MTGRVARLGARVKTDSLGRPLKEGDRVAYTYFYPCGRCYACLHEERAACPNKIERPLGPSAPPHLHGAFADHYYLRPGGALVAAPDMLSDGAWDRVGFPAVIREGIEMLRSGGTYLEIGTISRGAKIELEPSLLVWGSKRIIGVIQYEAWVIPRALDFLVRTRERWPWNRILSHKYPLEQINEAFAASEWHNRETTTITRAALTP